MLEEGGRHEGSVVEQVPTGEGVRSDLEGGPGRDAEIPSRITLGCSYMDFETEQYL